MALPSKKPNAARPAVQGKVVTQVPGFVLVGVRSGAGTDAPAETTPPEAQASALVGKMARALSRPGIRAETVFKGKTHNVYAYSVDATDPSRVVRTDAQGHRQIGRLVGDRFVPVKAA